jgi:hypothetical protein
MSNALQKDTAKFADRIGIDAGSVESFMSMTARRVESGMTINDAVRDAMQASEAMAENALNSARDWHEDRQHGVHSIKGNQFETFCHGMIGQLSGA